VHTAAFPAFLLVAVAMAVLAEIILSEVVPTVVVLAEVLPEFILTVVVPSVVVAGILAIIILAKVIPTVILVVITEVFLPVRPVVTFAAPCIIGFKHYAPPFFGG
jgi:hypothetical protein